MRSLALALAVTFPLLAAGGSKTPPPPPASPAPEKPAPKPVKLAAPGFTAVNVDDKVATFFSDHFAQQLALAGLSVISASEIQTLIGFERSKQLMGCSESSQSCMAELGDALGVDGVVTGSIGKFGGTFQANIKVLQAGSAQALSIISRKASSDEDMLNTLTDAAQQAASDIFKKLGREAVAAGAGGKASGGYIEENGHKYRVADETPPSPSSESIARPQDSLKARPSTTLTLGLSGQYFGLTSPAGFVSANGGGLTLQFERAVSPHFSLLVAPVLDGGEDSVGGVLALLELGLGARWYPGGTAPEGFWASPSARLYVGGVGTAGFYGVSPGVALGYSLTLGPIAFSLGVGVNLYWIDQVFMFVPAGQLSVGLAF